MSLGIIRYRGDVMAALQRRACRSKRRFPSRPAAEAIINAEQWKHDRDGVVVRAYKCPCCPGWHLTSRESS